MRPRPSLAPILLLLASVAPATAQWINYPAPNTPRLADGKVNL